MPDRPTSSGVALSVKQPWAALLTAGLKTVEVRTWPTTRRGTVFLHAAKVPDDRPHGWTFLETPELIAAAELVGGVVAVAELVDCVTYSSAEAFAADAHRHRNLPAWFRAPRLYGFVFENVRPVTFRRVPGNTFFFPVSVPAKAECGKRNAELEATPILSGTPHSALSDPHSLHSALPTTSPLPPPAEPVIIIDPPEGKDARHHDHHQDARPAG